MNGYNWADLTRSDFETLDPATVAVQPLGATEQHGPHLPLSVDTDLTETALTRTRAHLRQDQPVLILPTLSVTKSNEHAAVAGTLTLSARTLLAVLEDIGASVARAGVRRLVFFNGHGGNTALLEIACRELRIAHGLITAHCSWFGFAEAETHVTPRESAHDIHGGLIETSAMLAHDPAKVDMHRAAEFRPKTRDWETGLRWTGLTGQAARPGWVIGDLNPDGACGDARGATAALGDALMETAGRNFAAFLDEFAAFDPS